jgi:hypothetical protein
MRQGRRPRAHTQPELHITRGRSSKQRAVRLSQARHTNGKPGSRLFAHLWGWFLKMMPRPQGFSTSACHSAASPTCRRRASSVPGNTKEKIPFFPLETPPRQKHAKHAWVGSMAALTSKISRVCSAGRALTKFRACASTIDPIPKISRKSPAHAHTRRASMPREEARPPARLSGQQAEAKQDSERSHDGDEVHRRRAVPELSGKTSIAVNRLVRARFRGFRAFCRPPKFRSDVTVSRVCPSQAENFAYSPRHPGKHA